MNKTTFGVAAVLFFLAGQALGEEVLYNGIRLPEPWPPEAGAVDYEPMRLPYIDSPPKVIPIDVGRQFFVDDFLIKQTTLHRVFHQAEYYAHNPVLKPDKSWETATGDPTAMPFSDGIWYDPQDKTFWLLLVKRLEFKTAATAKTR